MVVYKDSAGNVAPEVDSLDTLVLFKCEGGCELTEDEPIGPLYECSTCGTTLTRQSSADGDSNRCPDCNKFAAKIADKGCDQCDSEEVTEVDGVACPNCAELMETPTPEDWESHVATCYTAHAA